MTTNDSGPHQSRGSRTARTARRDRLAAADKQLAVEQERASGWEALAFEALRDDLAELALLRFDRASELSELSEPTHQRLLTGGDGDSV